jgi:tetratricopeptide (TPR) repeat protein
VSALNARLVGVVGLFEAAEPESEWDYAGFGEYAELSPHLLALAGHLDTTGVDRLRAARLLFRVGVSLQRRGDYQASLETLQRALTIKEAAYEPNHPELAATLANIGNTQQFLGPRSRPSRSPSDEGHRRPPARSPLGSCCPTQG